MKQSFIEGGWGMYPTALFGALLLAVAVAYALTPKRTYVPLLASLSALTLSSGLLGFTTGVITTIRHIDGVKIEPLMVALYGVGESLNNVGLALMLLTMAALLSSIGALRLFLGGGGTAAKGAPAAA